MLLLENKESILPLKAPNPQNGQTHSNNSSRILRRIVFSVFDHFVGLALKRLTQSSCPQSMFLIKETPLQIVC